MKKPFYQRLLTVITWIGGGILLLGAVLDAVSNTLSLIDIPSALIISLALGSLYVLINVILEFKKITWINSAGEAYRVTKLGKQINYSLIGIVGLMWACAYFNYHGKGEAPKLQKTAVFSVNDQRFKVLILPFQKECEYEHKQYDIGQVIQKRLEDMNEKESLNLQVHYLTDSIDFTNFSAEKADSIRKYHGANLIVYGFYSYSQCEGSTKDKICYNYIGDYDGANLESSWSHTEYKMQDFTGLEDIRKGTGQENIDYVIYYIAGVSLILKNEFNNALKKFQKIPLTAANERILYRIAICYYRMKMYDSAQDHLLSLIKVYPNNCGYLNNIGLVCLVTKKIGEAKKYLVRSLAQCPKDVQALHLMLHAYKAERDTAKAMEFFNKIVKLLPGHESSSYKELGEVYFEMNKMDKAKEFYGKYLNEFDSTSYDAREALESAEIGLDIGDTMRAARYLRAATVMDSTYARAWFKLGEYYFRARNDFLQSVVCLRKVITLQPGDAIAWAMLGRAYFENKEPGKAVACIEKSLSVTGQSAYAQSEAAVVYAGTDQIDKAIACMEKAVQLSPRSPRFHFLLGNLYWVKNEYQKAFERIKKGCELSDKCEYSYALAQLSAELRNKKNALCYLNLACRENPGLKLFAKSNYAFDWLWNSPEFKAIVQ